MMRLSGILLIGAVTLGGCASTPPAAEPTADPNAVYLETVRDTNALVGASDERLISLGESTCAAMKDGTSFKEAVRFLGIGGIDDADDAETIAAASIDAFCPEVDGG